MLLSNTISLYDVPKLRPYKIVVWDRVFIFLPWSDLAGKLVTAFLLSYGVAAQCGYYVRKSPRKVGRPSPFELNGDPLESWRAQLYFFELSHFERAPFRQKYKPSQSGSLIWMVHPHCALSQNLLAPKRICIRAKCHILVNFWDRKLLFGPFES